MCGIAGIARVHAATETPPAHASIPDAWLDLLDAAIAHRGPDGHGRFRDRAARADGAVVDVALAHRRLSVIDPAGGAQPLITGDGPHTLATVFNGCIYNHRELRKELATLGRRFTTDHADTEVIPHAYAQWHADAPRRLDGMFAYAVWDRGRAELTTSRDKAGEKPLYYTLVRCPNAGSVLVFASTAAAVGRWLSRFGADFGTPHHTCRPDGLREWLRTGGSLTPLLQDVQELPPGASCIFPPGRREPTPTPDPYWQPPPRQDRSTAGAREVDALVSRAVRSRLDADVPLGCFLSGGVDSSLVALHAKHALGSLRTFTVRMPDARYDESAFAAQAARAIGSTHTTLPCDARPADQLPTLIAQLGLPFADSSLLPTHWVSAAARQHVTVALTGDAGDELFAGYERYAAARWLQQASGILRRLPEGLGAGAHPKSIRSKLGRLGVAARGGYDELLSVFPTPMLAELAPGLCAAPHSDTATFPSDAPRLDFQTYLPGDLLRKTDTAAMSVALETRAPLLARDVVHFGLATPLEVLTRGGRKGLLRAAARLHLPAAIVDRPKMGFAIPVGDWFRTDFGGMRGLLRDATTSNDAFPADLLGVELDTGFVAKLTDEHMTGRRDHGQRLYLLLVLALWCREVRSW